MRFCAIKISARSKPEDKYGLRREVGLLGSLSLIVGCMVGSGIFVSPGGVLDRSGSVATAIIIWAVSGLVACLGEKCKGPPDMMSTSGVGHGKADVGREVA